MTVIQVAAWRSWRCRICNLSITQGKFLTLEMEVKAHLLRHGYEFFENHDLDESGEVMAEIAVFRVTSWR